MPSSSRPRYPDSYGRRVGLCQPAPLIVWSNGWKPHNRTVMDLDSRTTLAHSSPSLHRCSERERDHGGAEREVRDDGLDGPEGGAGDGDGRHHSAPHSARRAGDHRRPRRRCGTAPHLNPNLSWNGETLPSFAVPLFSSLLAADPGFLGASDPGLPQVWHRHPQRRRPAPQALWYACVWFPLLLWLASYTFCLNSWLISRFEVVRKKIYGWSTLGVCLVICLICLTRDYELNGALLGTSSGDVQVDVWVS